MFQQKFVHEYSLLICGILSSSCLWRRALKTFGIFLNEKKGKGVFCYVKEMMVGQHLRMRGCCQETNQVERIRSFSPSLLTSGEERGAIDLISHAR